MANPVKGLTIGQAVKVEELSCGFCLTDPSPDQATYVIRSIESESVALEIEATGEKLRIPTYLIKEAGSVPKPTLEAA